MIFVFYLVPRKVLRDKYDYSSEPDEPQSVDLDQNQDDLYDEDQFYRESEAIPPAPKLHRELSKSSVMWDVPSLEPSSSPNPPNMRSGSNELEGKLFSIYKIFKISVLLAIAF